LQYQLLTLQGALPRQASGKQKLCADLQGFSLHTAAHCGAGQRNNLERLCRYITCPALANDRVQINAAGQVALKLKTQLQNRTFDFPGVQSMSSASAHAKRVHSQVMAYVIENLQIGQIPFGSRMRARGWWFDQWLVV
jgi:Putative transposase